MADSTWNRVASLHNYVVICNFPLLHIILSTAKRHTVLWRLVTAALSSFTSSSTDDMRTDLLWTLGLGSACWPNITVTCGFNSELLYGHMTEDWPSHGVQRLRSTTGRSRHSANWLMGWREKAFRGTREMLSALSQMMREREALLRVSSWSGVNWPSLSYQNLWTAVTWLSNVKCPVCFTCITLLVHTLPCYYRQTRAAHSLELLRRKGSVKGSYPSSSALFSFSFFSPY